MSKMDEVAAEFARRREEGQAKKRQKELQGDELRKEQEKRRARFVADIERLVDDVRKWLAPFESALGCSIDDTLPDRKDDLGQFRVRGVALRCGDFTVECDAAYCSSVGAEYVAFARINCGHNNVTNLECRGGWKMVRDGQRTELTDDSLAQLIKDVYLGEDIPAMFPEDDNRPNVL